MPSQEFSENDSARLIRRYLKGETHVCRKLLESPQFYKMLEKRAKKYCTENSYYSWEDLAQIAFEKVLKAALNGRFSNGNVKDFYKWSTKVADNCILDELRKKSRENKRRINSDHRTSSDTEPIFEEVIPDSFNLWEFLEKADSWEQIEAAIHRIHEQDPQKSFLQIWKGLCEDKKQAELAIELKVKQPEVSKRKRELFLQVKKELGWLDVKEVEKELKMIRQGQSRSRSQTQW